MADLFVLQEKIQKLLPQNAVDLFVPTEPTGGRHSTSRVLSRPARNPALECLNPNRHHVISVLGNDEALGLDARV